MGTLELCQRIRSRLLIFRLGYKLTKLCWRLRCWKFKHTVSSYWLVNGHVLFSPIKFVAAINFWLKGALLCDSLLKNPFSILLHVILFFHVLFVEASRALHWASWSVEHTFHWACKWVLLGYKGNVFNIWQRICKVFRQILDFRWKRTLREFFFLPKSVTFLLRHFDTLLLEESWVRLWCSSFCLGVAEVPSATSNFKCFFTNIHINIRYVPVVYNIISFRGIILGFFRIIFFGTRFKMFLYWFNAWSDHLGLDQNWFLKNGHGSNLLLLLLLTSTLERWFRGFIK